MDAAALLARAERFALASLAFYKKLPKSAEAQLPGVQFYKAATSAWANYRASKRAQSRPHYISKLATCVEEIDDVGRVARIHAEGIYCQRRSATSGSHRVVRHFDRVSLSTARTNWNAELTRSRKPMRSSTFRATGK